MDIAQKPIQKKLSKKQAALVTAVLDPSIPTVAEAGRIAGYCDRQAASKALQLTTVQDALKEFQAKLVKKGVDDDALVGAIKDGLAAKETRFFAHEGEVTDERTVPDYSVRHKYLETVVKIRGLIRGDKEPAKNTQVNIYNFRDEKTEDLIRSIDEIISERMRSEPIKAQGVIPSV